MAIRIALISDIHFGQLSRTTDFAVPGESITDKNGGGKSLKDSLVDTLKEVNAKYLCIAGDLTSFGSPQEFVYCEKAILSVAEEANICQNRIIIGLGNHDIDWEISEIYNKYKNAPSDFPHDLVRQKYRKIAASASLTNIDGLYPSLVLVVPLLFLAS